MNCSLELLSEEEELSLIVDGQHTGTGNTTENVGTSTLEERLDTFSSDDLLEGIEGGLVLDGLVDRLVHVEHIEKCDSFKLTSPDVIIMRRRIVSRGYEAIPAPVVTTQPRAKDAKKLPSRDPTRTTGLMESYIPK